MDDLSDGIRIDGISFGKNKSSIVEFSNKIKQNQKKVVKKGHILSFEGTELDIIYDVDDKPWFRGNNFGKMLNYKSTDQAIRIHVENDEKKSKWEILGSLKNMGQQKSKMSNDMRTIYLNESGVYSLLLASSKDEAKKFKKWVKSDVLASINKTGKYDLIEDKLNTSYYSENYITKFEGKRVVYLAYCEDGGDSMWKYGISRHVVKRDFDELSKIFSVFRMVYVKECNDNDIVETKIETEFKVRKMWTPKVIKGIKRTELFKTTSDFDIEKVKKMVDDMICMQNIDNNENTDGKYSYLAEIERTKQKELDFKIKELEFKTLELTTVKQNFEVNNRKEKNLLRIVDYVSDNNDEKSYLDDGKKDARSSVKKSKLFVVEQEKIINGINQIIGFDGKNGSFLLKDIDNKKNDILKFSDDVKKYFNCSLFTCFKKTDDCKKCVSLIKSLYKSFGCCVNQISEQFTTKGEKNIIKKLIITKK